jgi:hypothetical protein
MLDCCDGRGVRHANRNRHRQDTRREFGSDLLEDLQEIGVSGYQPIEPDEMRRVAYAIDRVPAGDFPLPLEQFNQANDAANWHAVGLYVTHPKAMPFDSRLWPTQHS